MPIPELHFEDERKGLPRQPVPVRFAVLISGLTVLQFVEMMTNIFKLDDHAAFALLDCYEFSAGKIRTCRTSAISSIYEETKLLCTEKKRMKHLPSSWFVYSDDMVSAFSNWVDLTVGRESAWEDDMGLNWNPALYPFESEIKACSINPVSKKAISLREKGKNTTAQKYSSWHENYLIIKQQDPKKTDTYISGLIAKKFGASQGRVRRVISDMKNS